MKVRGLHGKFDYDVDLVGDYPTSTAAEPTLQTIHDRRLTLLYGLNGTGKTSLLTLLFHGLSAATNRGHRNAVARIRFKSFRVTYVGGDWIEYRRSKRADGPYTVLALLKGESHKWQFVPTERDPDPKRLELEARTLNALDINPVFLNDSRAFLSDLVEPPERADDRFIGGGRRVRVDEVIAQRRNADLTAALNRVNQYITSLVLEGAQRGSERVDIVYVNVVDAIVHHAGKVGRPKKRTIPDLRDRIVTTGERAKSFTVYGLVPEFPSDALLAVLNQAPERDGPVLEQVLTPYLDGYEQRMDSLDAGRDAVATFVTTIDSFLYAKHLRFRAPFGVSIQDDVSGDVLEPSQLSSGEKQILLLLSNIIAMRNSTRLFIVDEPELSLNPDWQRKLMPAVLKATEGSPVQVIAATHSIEIMAQYQERIYRLG